MDDDYDLTPEDMEAPYVPTPSEIASGCAAVRSTWTAGELRRRNAYASARIETPELSVGTRRLMSTVEG